MNEKGYNYNKNIYNYVLDAFKNLACLPIHSCPLWAYFSTTLRCTVSLEP
jgi:hypothetical protein